MHHTNSCEKIILLNVVTIKCLRNRQMGPRMTTHKNEEFFARQEMNNLTSHPTWTHFLYFFFSLSPCRQLPTLLFFFIFFSFSPTPSSYTTPTLCRSLVNSNYYCTKFSIIPISLVTGYLMHVLIS